MSLEQKARDKAEAARSAHLRGLSPKDAARVIDQTFLHPDATWKQVEEFITHSDNKGFRSLVVNPNHAEAAVKQCKTPVVSVAGFPMGFQRLETKIKEAQLLIQRGVSEIDYVVDIGAAKAGQWSLITNEAKAMVDAGAPVKAIIEAGLLSNSEKVSAAKALADAGVAYVKTSTGFLAGGATLFDTALLSLAVEGYGTGVKASGGVRTLEAVERFLMAGADVIGTSSGLKILTEASEA